KRLPEMAENAAFFVRNRPIPLDETAARLVTEAPASLLEELHSVLTGLMNWDEDAIESGLRAYAESKELKLGKVAQPLRAALTGTKTSPGIFEVLFALGREESLGRLSDAISAKEGGINSAPAA
ncbi:MAG: glutamate--tRNA ligase, partial [Pseudomonadota bacterium]